jgi:hypothetical protein
MSGAFRFSSTNRQIDAFIYCGCGVFLLVKLPLHRYQISHEMLRAVETRRRSNDNTVDFDSI